MVIVDTGFWVALYNPSDNSHPLAKAASLRWHQEGFITTHAVIAESCHLLRKRQHTGAMIAFVQALFDGEVEIHELPVNQLKHVAQLMRKYRDLPMDYADASLVLLAEHLGHGRILTTDQRDFGTYRWKNHYPFESVLEEDIE